MNQDGGGYYDLYVPEERSGKQHWDLQAQIQLQEQAIRKLLYQIGRLRRRVESKLKDYELACKWEKFAQQEMTNRCTPTQPCMNLSPLWLASGLTTKVGDLVSRDLALATDDIRQADKALDQPIPLEALFRNRR